MHDAHEKIAAYFEGKLDAEQVAELEAYLREDRARAKAFVRQAMLDSHLTELMHEQNVQDVTADLSGDSHFGVMFDAAAASNATPARDEQPPIHLDATALTREKYAAALSYVIRHTFTPKRIATLAAAATLVLSAVLAIVLLTGPEPQTITDNTPQPNTPVESAPPIPQYQTVATLTDQHNATWGRPASAGTDTGTDAGPEHPLKTGSKLHPNTRLTLTAGFAEITTARGAVAIVEAPATIEFIDNDNAIYLHTGKLVGICETDASKGFVVRTPHADITDLGTEFGVEAEATGTAVAVFQGLVQVDPAGQVADSSSISARLDAGFGAHVSASQAQRHIEPVALNPSDDRRFVRSINDAMDPAFAYRRAVLASSPMVYWGFDETGRTTANLAGQSDWDGKAIGQTDRGMGLFGSALKLTGQLESMGGFVSVMPLSFAQTQSYTLEAWCWLDQTHFGRVLALAALDEDLGIRPMHLSMIEVLGGDAILNVDKPEHPAVRFLHRHPPSSASREGENFFSDRAVATGQWVHLVAVKDQQGVQIYMNGQRVAQASTQQPVATDRPLDLYVGVSPIMLRPGLSEQPNDFRPFAGRIDEVAVYDTALTQDTIQHHFSLGQARTRQ